MDESEVEFEADESPLTEGEGLGILDNETEDESGITDTPAYPGDEPTD
jgi:hypothetical protein